MSTYSVIYYTNPYQRAQQKLPLHTARVYVPFEEKKPQRDN